jgi:TolA-binding protein
MIRTLEAALVQAVLIGLLLAGCRTMAEPESPPAEASQPVAEAGETGSAPVGRGEQDVPGPAQEQAGVSLSSPGTPAGPAEAESGNLPEPGAEEPGQIEVYSTATPLAPRDLPAGRQLPLPRTAATGPKPAAPKPTLPPASPPAADKGGSAVPAAKPQPPAPAAASIKPPAPATDSQERRREVLARRGDTVSIELEGKGWLFLGLPPSRGNYGVSYLSADSGGVRSSFSFKALEYGEYDLVFQLQDNSRGLLQNQTVRLRVLPEEQFRQSVARQAAVPEEPPLDPARLETAERLFAARAFDLALAEYLKVYSETDPLVNDRLATIYAETGEPASAAKYFEKNLSSPDPYGERAVVGLLRAGLAQGSESLVNEQLKGLLAVRALPIGRELLDTARFLMRRGRAAMALDLLLEYPRRYPNGAELDRAWFLLAQLYEQEWPMRDVAKAREYYKKIYDELPESAYAGEAQARIRYLDRYFFNVQ